MVTGSWLEEIALAVGCREKETWEKLLVMGC